MKLKKWITNLIIAIILIWLIFFVDWGCEDKLDTIEENQTEVTGGATQELDQETTQESQKCEEKDCPECEECEDKDCPSCPSCPSCPATKTVIEGADELASKSLVDLSVYDDRIINADDQNFTYWLHNTKDYQINNIHGKLLVEIDDDNEEIFLSDVGLLSKNQNTSFKIPVSLAPRDEEYEAQLTIFSANNQGKEFDVEFKVYNKNPDIEESEAFWLNSIIGFSGYGLTDEKVNLTLINNKNSEIAVQYIILDDEEWFLNETIASGQEFEFLKDKKLCTENEIYRLPIYINYTSGGFEFEISEEQRLVGYCR